MYVEELHKWMEAHPRGTAIAAGAVSLLAVAAVAWEIARPGAAERKDVVVLAAAALSCAFCAVAIWKDPPPRPGTHEPAVVALGREADGEPERWIAVCECGRSGAARDSAARAETDRIEHSIAI